MTFLPIALLALSMSSDAFAAALGKGARLDRPSLGEALRTGLIFGGDQMSDWTVMGRGHRYTFDNPQPALAPVRPDPWLGSEPLGHP